MSSPDDAPVEPWSADHDLDLQGVAAVLADSLPDLAGCAITTLGEGWDHRAFEAGGQVLRFAKRADVGTGMEREARLVCAIAPRLPLAVPALCVHAASPLAPHGWTRHAKIPGVPLSRASASRAQRRWIATRLGIAFSALHATPTDLCDALGVPVAGWLRPQAESRRALARLRTPGLGLSRDLVQRVERVLASPPPPGAGSLPLTHADAWPEHVLVDEASLEPTGILDWADAERGDPAMDFAGLWFLGGDEALEAGLGRYELPWDGALVARARFFGVHHAVGDAWYALQRGLPDVARGAREALLGLT